MPRAFILLSLCVLQFLFSSSTSFYIAIARAWFFCWFLDNLWILVSSLGGLLGSSVHDTPPAVGLVCLTSLHFITPYAFFLACTLARLHACIAAFSACITVSPHATTRHHWDLGCFLSVDVCSNSKSAQVGRSSSRTAR
jgi:hypothetical protein